MVIWRVRWWEGRGGVIGRGGRVGVGDVSVYPWCVWILEVTNLHTAHGIVGC